MKREERILKSLMTGLIYPAVLGTVMYLVLDTIGTLITGVAAGSRRFDQLVGTKLILLLITAAFYCADYLYLTFTNAFTRLFFFLDLVFLVTLYGSILAVRLGDPVAPPAWTAIIVCYGLFMGLYMVWDAYEYGRCPPEERGLYRMVLCWEGFSILSLIAAAVLGRFRPTINMLVVPLLLAVITGCFWYLTWKKRLYANDFK